MLDQDRGGRPAVEVGAAEVRAGEATRAELRLRDDRDLPAGERRRGAASSAGSGGRLPFSCCQRIAFSTRASTRMRKPVMPWRAGGSPVVIDVSAAGVVDGTTVVIGPPSSAESSGSSAG